MTTHFKTYDQVGKKEDISDVISNIAPTQTPFQSLIGDEGADNTLYQWQEDDLSAVKDNAAVEGADATDEAMTPTVMRSNVTQIFHEDHQGLGHLGPREDLRPREGNPAYQLGKKSMELKREMEYALIGKAQNAIVGTSATARKFGNVFGLDAAGTAMISPTVTVDHTATPAALTEADVLTVNQKLYENGADAKFHHELSRRTR